MPAPFSPCLKRVLPAREMVGGSDGKRYLAGTRNEDRNSSSKTITYPSCSPGAHFHPSKRGKESHRLRYANYYPYYPYSETRTLASPSVSLRAQLRIYTCVYTLTKRHRSGQAVVCRLPVHAQAFLILSAGINTTPWEPARVRFMGTTQRKRGETDRWKGIVHVHG